MDECAEYFYNKAKKRINGFLRLCIIGCIVAMYFVLKYNSEGRYEDESTVIMVPIICAIGILVYILFYKGLLKLSCKSQTWAAVALLLSWPIGLYFYWPIIKMHRGDVPKKYSDDKVLKDTVRAYQKAWNRQCFVQRVGIPLLLAGALFAIVMGFDYVSQAFPKAFETGSIIVIILAYIFTIYLIGGVREVRRTTDYYNVEIGTGIFDYGEVKFNKYDSKTRDETDVSGWAMLIALPLTPFVIVLFIVLVFAYVFLQVIRILFPTGGRRSIYLHKRKLGVNPAYMPCADGFLNVVFILINKILGLIFRVNLVNDDFWYDGVGPSYILQNLSNRNIRFLEKELEKVERKHGYYYNF